MGFQPFTLSAIPRRYSKFNRLFQIDDTGVGTEALDDQAAGCGTEPAGFFKTPPQGESHDKAGFLRAGRRFALAVSPSPVFRDSFNLNSKTHDFRHLLPLIRFIRKPLDSLAFTETYRFFKY